MKTAALSRTVLKRRVVAAFCALSLCLAFTPRMSRAQTKAAHLLIYAIDVEGGQSTLLVSPSGGSLLVDTGWGGNNGRDAERIQTAMKDAGITKIDKVLITHFHTDHVGGVPNLVERAQVGEFLDHGPNREDSDITRHDYAAYLKAIAGKPHRVVRPGDTINVAGLSVLVLTADGEHIGAVPGVKPMPNPYCASEPKWDLDTSENPRSTGVLVRYGAFRFLDLGDLTKAKEIPLVCPENRIGTVDLYLVDHHGMNLSNAKAFVDAIHPRVAIMDNGAHKAGSPGGMGNSARESGACRSVDAAYSRGLGCGTQQRCASDREPERRQRWRISEGGGIGRWKLQRDEQANGANEGVREEVGFSSPCAIAQKCGSTRRRGRPAQ